MSHAIFPLPSLDFDPTEVAVTWRVLRALGHRVSFATCDGREARADDIMLTGRGLDPWSSVPLLGELKLVGLFLRANATARAAYRELTAEPAFRAPLDWGALDARDFDGIVLCGGHRARGMRPYLESALLQSLVTEFFALDKPVGAICHGVVLVARSRDAQGRSVLYGRRTTALPWDFERTASAIAHVGRFADPDYYRTYVERPGEPSGYASVQHEVTRSLASPGDFIDVPADAPDRRRKTSGLHRDSAMDARPAFVVRDRNYVSARWPGDAHAFARAFAERLSARATTPDTRAG